MKRAVFLLLLFSFALLSAENADQGPCLRGTIDLRDLKTNSTGIVKIEGEAPFYWKRFIHSEDLAGPRFIVPSVLLPLPGNWNNLQCESGVLPGIGWGTMVIEVIPPEQLTPLALKIPAIRTAYSLYVDTQFVAGAGVPGTSAERTAPAYKPQVVQLPLTTNPYTLIFHISNFNNNKGGPWQAMYIGKDDSIGNLRNRSYFYDVFIIGLLFFLMIIHVTNFRFNSDTQVRTVIMALAGFTLSMLVRTGLTGERLFYFLLPDISSEFMVRFEYISLFSAGIFFHLFIHGLFPNRASQKVRSYAKYGGMLFVLLALVIPVKFSSNLIPLFQFNIFAIMSYQLYLAYSERNTRGGDSVVHIISILILFIAVLHDIQTTLGTAPMLSLTPLANFCVILVQTILLIREQSNVYRDRAHLEIDLGKMRTTFQRFVPTPIFSLLGTSLEMVQVGIRKELPLTVMSADIRGFTALSERMSPETNYAFINRFLSSVTPIVTEFNGFINNFIGDAFVAVFTDPVDSIRAARKIQEIVTAGDQFSSFMLKDELKLGIGIDHGSVTLGIQGGDIRMGNMLFGPVVHYASRLEELTKHTGASILVSDRLREILPVEFAEGRFLGSDYLKFEELKFHELFAVKDSADSKRKRRTLETIAVVVDLIEQGKKSEARETIDAIPQEVARYDQAIEYLKERCKQ